MDFENKKEIDEMAKSITSNWSRRCLKRGHKFKREVLEILEQGIRGSLQGVYVREVETCRRRRCKYRIQMTVFQITGKV